MQRSSLLLAVAAGFLTFAATAGAQPTDPASLPDVVARVNGLEISKAELLTQANILRGQAMRSSGQDPAQAPGFYRNVLDGLIGELLVFVDIDQRKLAVSDAEVDQALASMEERYADAAAFDQALAQQGTSRAEVRQQLKRSLSVEKVIRSEIESKIEISDASKREFYDANRDRMQLPERRRIRHILRRVAPGASAEEKAEVRSRVKEIRRQIVEGADFATLAKEFSEDAMSQDKGGELPWVAMTGQQSPFYDAVAALETGELSELVETEAGFHLVEVLEVRPSRLRTFEEVEENITDHLKNEAVFEAVQKRVQSLYPQAEVEILI